MKSNNNLDSVALFVALVLGAGSLQARAFGAEDDVDRTAYTVASKARGASGDNTFIRPEDKTRKAASQTSFLRG